MKNTLINIARFALVIGLLTPSFGHAISTSVCKATVKQSCLDAKSSSGSGTSTGSTGIQVTVGTGAQGDVTAITNITQTCEQLADAACSSSATSGLTATVPVVP